MAKKAKQPQRGATPLPTPKEKRELRLPEVTLPRIPWGTLAAVLMVAALSAGAVKAYQSWPVTDLEISGRMQVWNVTALEKELSWVKQKNFFSLDINQVREELQALPLLSRVIVQKRWPGKVIVQLTEDLPVAVWNEQQLLSAGGVISEIPMGLDTSALIHMRGPELKVTEAAHYFRRIQQLLNPLHVSVVTIQLSSVQSVHVELSNGWQVAFGRQYFEERALRLKKLIEVFPAEKISSIDLRYGKGVAIRWRSEQEMG